MNEIRKATYDFDKSVLKGGLNEITGKIIAEKVLHYIEDLNKAKVCRLSVWTFSIKLP